MKTVYKKEYKNEMKAVHEKEYKKLWNIFNHLDMWLFNTKAKWQYHLLGGETKTVQ